MLYVLTKNIHDQSDQHEHDYHYELQNITTCWLHHHILSTCRRTEHIVT